MLVARLTAQPPKEIVVGAVQIVVVVLLVFVVLLLGLKPSVAVKPTHIVDLRTNTKVIAKVITSHAVKLVVNMCHVRSMPSHGFPMLEAACRSVASVGS